jgi:hypothetical protein
MLQIATSKKAAALTDRNNLPINAIRPISRPSVKMRHRDHDDRLFVDAVHQGIRETVQQTTSNFWFDFCGSERMRFDQTNGAIEFIQKIATEN